MPLKMQNLIGIGVLLIVLGFIIVFFGMLSGSKDYSKTKVAVGGFIGFIPFGFGNDRQLVRFAAILAIVVFLIWIFFNSRIWK